jgi:hypothetical protein
MSDFSRRFPCCLRLDSFTWFMAEPDCLMILRDGKPVPLASLR